MIGTVTTSYKCPKCGVSVSSVSIRLGPDGPVAQITCPAGHVSQVDNARVPVPVPELIRHAPDR